MVLTVMNLLLIWGNHFEYIRHNIIHIYLKYLDLFLRALALHFGSCDLISGHNIACIQHVLFDGISDKKVECSGHLNIEIC